MSEFTSAADQSFKSTPPENNPKGNTAVQNLFTDDGVEYGSQAANIDISTGFDADVKLGARLELYMPLFIDIVISPAAYLFNLLFTWGAVYNKIMFTLGGQWEIVAGCTRSTITGSTVTNIYGNVWEKTGDLKYEEYGTQALLSSASPAGATPFTNIMTVARGAIPTSLESLRNGGGRTTVNFGNKNSYCYGQAISINAVGPLQVVTGFSCKYTLSGKHLDWISAHDAYSTKFGGNYWTQETSTVMCNMTAGNFRLVVGAAQSAALQTTITDFQTNYNTLKASLNQSMKDVAPGADKNLPQGVPPIPMPVPTALPAFMNFQDGLVEETYGSQAINVFPGAGEGTFSLYAAAAVTIQSGIGSIIIPGGDISLGAPVPAVPPTPLAAQALADAAAAAAAELAELQERETIAWGAAVDPGFGV
jgi:hypothetical protein